MKPGWSCRRVEEFAAVCLGKMLDKAKNRGVLRPYLRNLNVRWFGFDLSNVLEMPFENGELDRYTVRSGDLLVCEGGYPGRAAIWDGEPVCFQKAIHRVRCREPGRARWLLYFLLMSDLNGSLKVHFTGTGIQHFTAQVFKKLEVPLPPLSEQQRIVAILDQAFDAIATATANAGKNAANTREILESSLEEVFVSNWHRWPVHPIRSVADVFDGPHATPKIVDTGPIFLNISALQDGQLRLGDTRHVTERDFVRWTRRVEPRADDFVFSYETRLGEAALIPDGLRCCLGRRMGLLRFKGDLIDPRFLLLQYISRPFRKFLASKTVRGATVDRISVRDFPNFLVRVPHRGEQGRIVAHADALRLEMDRLAAIQSTKLAALAELKQSLLARAFAGELTTADSLAA